MALSKGLSFHLFIFCNNYGWPVRKLKSAPYKIAPMERCYVFNNENKEF